MIEILILVNLCKKIGEILRQKGRKPFGYQLTMVLVWFGAEFLCALQCGIILALIFSDEAEIERFMPICYLAAILGAGLGSCSSSCGASSRCKRHRAS